MTQNRGLRIGITVVALILVVLHVWNPGLQIDSISVVMLIVAILPWVQPLIKSIELLGVKLELQDLKNELADAKGAAKSAERKADYLLAGSVPAPATDVSAEFRAQSPDESFIHLMRVYEHIRATQPSGGPRTRAMTAIMRQMIELAPSLQQFDVKEALMSDQTGTRLAAYAFLYARPDMKYINVLTASVTRREDTPFGQYWGLQAITRVLSSRGSEPVPDTVRTQLREFAARLPRGTDRDYEIRGILRELQVSEVGD